MKNPRDLRGGFTPPGASPDIASGLLRFRREPLTGFTLIELLVVIAIIGILASIVLGSLNTARQKARDARRVADIKSIQLALEFFYDTCGGYPVQDTAGVLLTSRTYGSCSPDTMFAKFLSAVPGAPVPPAGNVYTYLSADGSTYTIEFTLEQNTGSLTGGPNSTYIASPAGIAEKPL